MRKKIFRRGKQGRINEDSAQDYIRRAEPFDINANNANHSFFDSPRFTLVLFSSCVLLAFFATSIFYQGRDENFLFRLICIPGISLFFGFGICQFLTMALGLFEEFITNKDNPYVEKKHLLRMILTFLLLFVFSALKAQ